ncbi:hypothetical protein [Eggerthella timonensis]|uniref:hypothetical protein n=1 Tax=Eggerthella timonensis TaxID=1871008 RepID=UPI000C78ABED|nr:hypothetical protein [Eggerthella timonensis]
MAAAVESGELEGEGFKPAGIGTEDDPYAISTPEAFAWWAAHKAGDANTFARLDADIDLTGTAHAEAGTLWTPIETLAAELDGQGHAILFRTQGAGLAGTVAETGAVRWFSLGRTQRQLEEAAAQGGEAAALAETSVTTEGSRAGAVAGINKGAIEGVVNRMPVSWQPAEGDASDPAPSSLVGGIAGENDGRIADCANLGAVSSASASSDSAAAGIAGAGAGTVETSYNAGSVKAAANGAYLATTLTADGAYEDLVRTSLYLAPGNEAAYEGIAVADRDGALPPDQLRDAAELLNDGREGDAVVWSSGDPDRTSGYPAPARPANPNAAQAEPEALAAEPAPAAADDPAPAATPIFKNWLEVAEAVDQGKYGMGSYKEDPLAVSTPEGFAYSLYCAYRNTDNKIVLANDIDLSGTSYTADGSPLPWTCWNIESNIQLDGAGCTISGMHVWADGRSTDHHTSAVSNMAGLGLFAGTVHSGSSELKAVVTNLTLEGVIDMTTAGSNILPNAAGSVVGYLGYEECPASLSLRNVTSNVEVKSRGYAGGLVGAVGGAAVCEMQSCTNKGTIYADGEMFPENLMNWSHSSLNNIKKFNADPRNYHFAIAGGLVGVILPTVGSARFTASDCKNIGTVTSPVLYAGGLVGWYAGQDLGMETKESALCTITRSYNEGAVESTGGYAGPTKNGGPLGYPNYGGCAGGLVGSAEGNIFTRDCYNRGPVHSGFLAGGIFGTLDPSPLSYQYFSTYNAAAVTTSYTDSLTDKSGLPADVPAPRGQGGGVFGYIQASHFDSIANYFSYNRDMCSSSVQHGMSATDSSSSSQPLPSGFTTDQMKTKDTSEDFVGFLNAYSETGSSNPIWSYTSGRNDGYPFVAGAVTGARYASWADVGREVANGSLRDYQPVGDGTKDNPYRVTTPEALAYLFYQANTGYKFTNNYVCIRLGADIDLSGMQYGGLAWQNGTVSPALTWEPWGDLFYGSFEGAGHTISGLSVDMEGGGREKMVGGLFLQACTSEESWSEGLETTIGGFILEGTIVAGTADAVGGVVGGLGYYYDSTKSKLRLHDIESRVTIRPYGTQTYNSVGGIVGLGGAHCEATIERCGFSGDIDFKDAGSVDKIGGIAGTVGEEGCLATLEDCYSTGAITACQRAGHIGGVAGVLFGSIRNSYAKPSVFSVPAGPSTGLVVATWLDGSQTRRVFIDPTDLDKFNVQPVSDAIGFTVDPTMITEVDSDYMKTGVFAASLNCSRESPVWGSSVAGENGGFPVLHGAPDIASWMEIGKAVEEGSLVDSEYNSAFPEVVNGTYILRTPEQLAYYSYHVRETYRMSGSADPSYQDEGSKPVQKPARIEAPALDMMGAAYGGTWAEPLAWEPIGNSYWKESEGRSVSRPLYGTTFDGGDSVISHLRVQGATDEKDAKVEGRGSSAALIGEALQCTVKNVRLDKTCSSTGYLTLLDSKLYTAAGIVGTARSTLVENCSSSATVTAACNDASFDNLSMASNSVAAGGVVGVAYDDKGTYEGETMISRCSNAGAVISKKEGTETSFCVLVAGIAGAAWSTYGSYYLEDCYNVGVIGGNKEENVAAGITGGAPSLDNSKTSAIVRACYNAGVIATPTTTTSAAYAICGEQQNYDYTDPDRPNFLVSDNPSGLGEYGYCDKGYYAEWSISDGKLPKFVTALNAGRVGKDAPWVFDSENVNGGLPVFGINFGAWAEVGEAVANGKLTGDGFVPTQAGTVDDPYQISTPEALAWFAYKVNTDRAYGVKSAKLMANIDLDGSKYTAVAKSLANAMPWTPIGNDGTYWFGADAAASGQGEYKTVVFDGNGKTVDYMLVNRAVDYSGLIGCAHNCTIKGVTIGKNSSVTGKARTGGVAGGFEGWSTTHAIRVESCVNYATIKGSQKTAGIIGNLPTNQAVASMAYCGNYGSVTTSQGDSGGVAGQACDGRIEYCFNRGYLKTGSGGYGSGGICSSGYVYNSYNAGTGSTNSKITARRSATNCYYTTDGMSGSNQGVGVTAEQMKSWAAAYALNGKNYGSGTAWAYDSSTNEGYPSFGELRAAADWGEVGLGVDAGLIASKPAETGADAENAFELGTEEALAWFAYKSNTEDTTKAYTKCAKITASTLDLTGTKYGGTSSAKLQWSSIAKVSGGHGTVPGTFGGTFDGQRCVIKNLYQSNPSAAAASGWGLFAFLYGGTVKDVVLENVDINISNTKAYVSVGGIVSQAAGGAVVLGCAVNDGTIKGTVVTAQMVGGIMGDSHANGSTIENCYVRASVTVTGGSGGGGILGRALSGAKMKNCYFAGTAQGSPLCSQNQSNATFTNCYYDSTLFTGSAERAGVKGLSTAQMQSWAAAYALNGKNYGSGTAWAYDAAANDGYPSFGELRAAADWGEVGFGVDADLIAGKPAETGDNEANAFQLGSEEALAWFAYKSNTGDPKIAYTKCAKITASALDLTGTKYGGTPDAKLQWSSIAKVGPGHSKAPGTYGGTFDGQGRVIKNLYQNNLSAPGKGGWGLFAFLHGGTVKNVVLEDVDISVSCASDYITVGGIVSQAEANAVISGCAVNGGTIKGASPTEMTGGIVGDVHEGGAAIENCYVRANVGEDALRKHGGGIVGRSYNPVTVKNSYYVGKASKPVCYSESSGTGKCKPDNVFYDSTAYGSTAPAEAGVTALSTDQMQSWAAAWALNGKKAGTPWTYDASKNDGYPSFGTLAAPADWSVVGAGVDAGLIAGKPAQTADSAADAYDLGSPEALAWFAYKVNADNANYKSKHAKLAAPIDLSGKPYTGEASVASDFSNCLKWKPIASFSGEFDGGGHAVENLFVNEGTGRVGFFGTLQGTDSAAVSVHDFGVASGSVKGLHTVGGIVGKMERVKGKAAVSVERCWNAASVTGTGSDSKDTMAGGIAGYVFGTVSNCYNTGSISAAKTCAGGIVGSTTGDSAYGTRVESCYNTGSVTAPVTYGAINGWHSNAQSPTTNCYYLDNGLPAFGNNATAGQATKLADDQLKSWGAAYALNGGDGTQKLADLATWRKAKDASENAGYPVLCTAGESMDAAADWGEVGAWVDAIAVSLQPSTASDGAYEISSPEQLAWFAYKVNTSATAREYGSKSVRITGDVDLDGSAYTGKEKTAENALLWVPIGKGYSTETWDLEHWYGGEAGSGYKGVVFDGGGHAVDYMRAEGEEYVGFIGVVRNATLKGIVTGEHGSVTSTSQDGSSSFGGVAGGYDGVGEEYDAGDYAVKVENCVNRATVSTTYCYETGGIIGTLPPLGEAGVYAVERCANHGTVGGWNDSNGGIVGDANSNEVAYCYNVGRFDDDNNGGSMSGIAYNASRVVGCYNASETVAEFPICNGDSSIGESVDCCFVDIPDSGMYYENQGTPLTDAQMKSWNAAYLLNGSAYVGSADGTAPASTVWTTDEQKNGSALKNGGYPVFGDLKLKELTVTLDPKDISTKVDSSKKATGEFMEGPVKKPLSGPVTLEQAPANPSGATLASAADVDAAFSTWGTTSANGKFALAAGNVSLTPSSATGDTALLGTNLAGIDLHTAAAYTSGDARSTSFIVADDYAHYKVSVTVKAFEGNKTLDVAVPVETSSSFELSPDGEVHQGDNAAKAAAPSTLKSNNAMPVAGSVKSVVPMAQNTELSAGDKVNAVLDPVAESDVLKATSDPVTQPGNAKLFVLGSDGTGELAKLDAPLYYDPANAKVPLAFSVPGGEVVRWKWGMDYTGTYIGTTGVFGYTVGYDLRLSENDVAAPVLSAGAK